MIPFEILIMAKRQVAPKTHVIQGGCDPM